MSPPKLHTLALVLLAATLPSCLRAQTAQPAAPAPAYDVSTVRLNKTGSGDVHMSTRNGNFDATNVPLKSLIQFAYDIRRDLIFGLPAWVEAARYDISAKVTDPDNAQLKIQTREQRQGMLRSVIEQRFALKWHFDTKVVPVYELVVLKTGPKMQVDTSNGQHSGNSMNNTDLTGTDIPMTDLADILSDHLERPVVDKTGLTAKYDFRLRWTPDGETAADNGKDTDAPPPLFTAIQEQLGLRLQPGKDSVRTLVVDQIQPPSDN